MAEIIRNGNEITIVCGSRIDTINAGAFENEITPVLAEKDTQLVFDCNGIYQQQRTESGAEGTENGVGTQGRDETHCRETADKEGL